MYHVLFYHYYFNYTISFVILQSYKQHRYEPDPERVNEIILKSVEDANWIVNKVSTNFKHIIKSCRFICINAFNNIYLTYYLKSVLFVTVHQKIMEMFFAISNTYKYKKCNFIHDKRIL